MTIVTNIGNFANWYSIMCEMQNEKIESIKVKDTLCIAHLIHLGAIPGEFTFDEVKEMAAREYR